MNGICNAHEVSLWKKQNQVVINSLWQRKQRHPFQNVFRRKEINIESIVFFYVKKFVDVQSVSMQH